MKLFPITENHLYQKAYRGGRKAFRPTVSLYVLKDKHASLIKKSNPSGEYLNRYGISASKKIGGAVQRNRAKRVAREAIRQIGRENIIKKGFLVVIALKQKATVCKMQEIKKDLLSCLTETDMILSGDAGKEGVPAAEETQKDEKQSAE